MCIYNNMFDTNILNLSFFYLPNIFALPSKYCQAAPHPVIQVDNYVIYYTNCILSWQSK